MENKLLTALGDFFETRKNILYFRSAQLYMFADMMN